MSRTVVEFIPWDTESTDHVDRLVQQRVDCGWHSQLVDGLWKEAQRSGIKYIYWLALVKNDPKYDFLIQKHTASFPEQASPLYDSCNRIGITNRVPTGRAFIPVGHISLETKAPETEKLGLDIPDSGVVWLKTGYVSRALQSSGIGRAALDGLEVMVTSEPLYARTLMLDTLSEDDQLREDVAMAFFGAIPKVANEVWFKTRGYKTIKTVHNYYNEKDNKGRPLKAKTVFMRRDLKGATPHL